VNFNDWLLGFHLWSAFALVGSMVLFWTVVVVLRNAGDVDSCVAYGRVTDVGSKLVGVGFAGTIIFGISLAFNKDGFAIWDGWIIAAIILWVIGGATGGRAGSEYMKAHTRAKELQAAGQSGQSDELRALNRTSSGLLMLAISSLAIALIVIDMIWKPGADALADLRPNNFNFALFIHVLGATILVGGVLTAASAFAFARGSVRQLRFGWFVLLFVALPGLALAKLGATAIWNKESAHSFIGSAFPHSDDPRWIEIGGTALDGGGVGLVLALILGWIGLRRMREGKGGEGYLKLTMLISFALLAGYFLAIWAMAGKPG
jgi:hypothetical protein